MKLTLLRSLLFPLILFSCNANGPEASALETPVSASTPTVVSDTPQSPPAPTLSISELFPLSEATAIIGCNGEPSTKKDDRDHRTSVTYSCTDPFTILSAALTWTKDGSDQDVSRRDNNSALEKVSVNGTDAAHLMAAQGRLMVAKGKYQLTVQLPNGEQATLISIAENILGQL